MRRPAMHRGLRLLLSAVLPLLALSGCAPTGTSLPQAIADYGRLAAFGTKAPGYPISRTRLKVRFPANAPAGERMYSLYYWSRGQEVQGYLNVPPGKGPFDLLVALHGGYLTGVGQHTDYSVYARSDAVGTAMTDTIDTMNGLKALSRLGLHIRRNATYLYSRSLGGYVAMMLAAHDSQVQASVLRSPDPGAIEYMTWINNTKYPGPYAIGARTGRYQAWGTDLTAKVYRQNSFPYRDIHTPVLIIGGESDRTFPPPLLTAMYHRASLQFFPGGHDTAGGRAHGGGLVPPARRSLFPWVDSVRRMDLRSR